jgi:hypothetical protein
MFRWLQANGTGRIGGCWRRCPPSFKLTSEAGAASLNLPRDAEAATLAPRFEDARLAWKEGTDSRKQAVSV